MHFIQKHILRITKRLAQPDIFFYCGLWLLVLLCYGTVSQKYIGLYQAQHQFFSSFFFWFYNIPLPAARTTMALILLSLSLKIIFYTQNLKIHLGSLVTHIGIVVLFLGGFIYAVFRQEGYIQIPEGQHSRILSDYHKVELVLISQETGHTISFKEKGLKTQSQLIVKDEFILKVQDFFKNTEPIKRSNPPSDSFKGFSKIFQLKQKPLEKINEMNRAGLTFQIVKNNKTEIYSVFEGMPIDQTLKWKNQTYVVKIRPIQTELPFSIHLIDFKKTNYPGTNQPRMYQSTVEIQYKTSAQKRVIKMNQPLRYKGWTLYQSSFIENKKSETTILAGVKNPGRAFPYLSSLIICFGILIHIFNPLLGASRRKDSK